MPLTSKLPDVGVTIFSVMSQLAADHQAVNLSQGFPDFDPPAELVHRVTEHMQAGRNQYAPMSGIAPLRHQLAAKVKTLYGASVDPDRQITVTSGATEALYAAITAVVHPGDEVILFEPAYDAYEPVIRLSGGVPVHLQMRWPGYRIDWDQVNDRLTDHTRLMILNSPHNPTGTVLTADDMAALQQIVAKHPVLLLSDEVYEHIVFDGRRHESVLRYPQLAARSFAVSSFGKTYHTTGWKIGYCVAPAEMTTEFQRIHQFLTFASHTPSQFAYADMLSHPSLYLGLASFYQQKRDRFLDLTAASRFRPLACHGTYFQMMDYSDISSDDDVAFARRMTSEYGVAAIPPSVFYHDRQDHKVLRFCFAKQDDTLATAAEKLCRI